MPISLRLTPLHIQSTLSNKTSQSTKQKLTRQKQYPKIYTNEKAKTNSITPDYTTSTGIHKKKPTNRNTYTHPVPFHF